MGSRETKEVSKQRGATIKAINADLKSHRGLDRGRGVGKAPCAVLWCAPAHNLPHLAGVPPRS